MGTYKNLIGKDVNFLTTDPDNDAAEGQIWYNSTSNVFKDLLVSEAWSASGGLGSGRYALGQGTGGTVNAGIAVFGRKAGPAVNSTEEYNGSGWSTGGDGNTARYGCAKFGTQTAAVAAGGKVTVPSVQNVEEYNGTSWSEETDYPSQARQYLSGFGTLTAGVICSGHNSGTFYGLTDEYDGTNWTTGGVMNNVRSSAGTTGILTAGLIFGGQTPSITAKTEEYNGTAWTESGDMGTARSHLAGSGTQDAALAYGGFTPPSTTQTEAYNGSTWSTSPATLATATARNSSVGSGASTGLSFGGNPPGTAATEEYNRSINVITAGAWSAGGTIPYSSPQKNGSGILTAAFAVGGETPPGAMVNTSVKYDGTSWTATNNINSARGDVMAAGTLTAGLIMGGYQNVPDPNFLFEETEEFNGTSWSEVNDMPTGAYSGSGTGTQTAAFVNNMYIGSPGERTNVTYEYDGTNWSNGGSTAETTNSRSSVGTLTAGLTVGGRPAPTSYIDKTELYDGTSWTSGVDMISIFQAGGQSSKGTQSDCIIFGSPKTPANTDTYKTDGTSWFTQPSMATYQNNGTGTSTAALAFGNGDTSVEFTGETTALNIKTITTS